MFIISTLYIYTLCFRALTNGGFMEHPAWNPTPSSPPVTGWKYSDDVWKDDEQLTVRQAAGKDTT